MLDLIAIHWNMIGGFLLVLLGVLLAIVFSVQAQQQRDLHRLDMESDRERRARAAQRTACEASRPD